MSQGLTEGVYRKQKMLKKKYLENEIKKIRNEMIKVGMVNGLNDKNTIQLSQHLDRVLNEYEQKRSMLSIK